MSEDAAGTHWAWASRDVTIPGDPGMRAGRKKATAVAVLVGLAAVDVLAAVLLVEQRGEEPGQLTTRESRVEQLGPPPGPGPDGLPQHPPLRLTHPDGAEVVVPPAQTLYGEYLDVRRLDRPTDAPAWAFVGNAWRFVSTTGVVHDRPIQVRLPPGDGGPTAQVVILMPSGAWQPLPTAREAGVLVADVTGMPAPWVVAIAERRPVPGRG